MDPASVSQFLALQTPLLPLLLLCSILLVLWMRSGSVSRPRSLPPGSLGLPLLGETVRLISAYKTEHPEPFVDERLRRLRLGQRVFTTHLFGERTVFSADPDVNKQVLQGEGRLFECSYPSSLTTLLGRRSLIVMHGAFHRRMHTLLSATISNPCIIRDRLLPDINRLICRTLDSWEDNAGGGEPTAGRRVLLQDQAKKITFELSVKQLMSMDPGEWTEGLRKEYLHLIDGFFSLPLPFSFTTYGRALKARARLGESLSSVVRRRKREMVDRAAEDGEREAEPAATGEKRWCSDLLGALLGAESEDGEEFTEEEAVDFLLALLVAGYETTSTIMTLAVKYLADQPRALALLREEHDEIRRRKAQGGHLDDALDWADYKSMTFTQCVINETMRVANIISGVFRRATTDVPIKGGYTIPKGCKVFASFRAVHMDPAYFVDARTFDPWRWMSPPTQQAGGASAFCPFGGGARFCPGFELARVEISVFLHYLVTRFCWEPAEEDKVIFFPTTRTVKGCPINVRPRGRVSP